MGCWTALKHGLHISPEVDDKFILAFDTATRNNNPGETIDECYQNPWFVNNDNCLMAYPTKFGEIFSWLTILREQVFEPLGFVILNEPEYLDEWEFDFEKEFEILQPQKQEWERRKKDVRDRIYEDI